MYDKFGRYVHVTEIKAMRIFKVSGLPIVFIAHQDVPIYLMIEVVEKTYEP